MNDLRKKGERSVPEMTDKTNKTDNTNKTDKTSDEELVDCGIDILRAKYNSNTPFIETVLKDGIVEPVVGDGACMLSTPWERDIRRGLVLNTDDLMVENKVIEYRIPISGHKRKGDEQLKKEILANYLKTLLERDILADPMVSFSKKFKSLSEMVEVKVVFSCILKNNLIEDFLLASGFPVGPKTMLILNPENEGELHLEPYGFRYDPENRESRMYVLKTRDYNIPVAMTNNLSSGKAFILNLDAFKLKIREVYYTEENGKMYINAGVTFLMDGGQLIELSSLIPDRGMW